MNLETIPEPPIQKESWARQRIYLQEAIMERMGLTTRANTVESHQQISAWALKYAKPFADLTRDDADFQERLTSDDEVVRESALTEIIALLEED